MARRIYYIDPKEGNDANDGLKPERPWQTYARRTFAAGDMILFKRGSVFREVLHTCSGTKEGDITYGAYGSGRKPTFLGSLPANDPGQWTEQRPGIWRFKGAFPNEVCNLVFNNGELCGTLRWQIDDLKNQGEWYYTGFGFTGSHEAEPLDCADCTLYLCSQVNPGRFYSSIECVIWGERRLVNGKSHIVLENLAFRNSGVHGYQDVRPEHVTIRNCEFRFIGGAVWFIKQKRLRFGNAVELWDGALDVVVEDCLFDNIYDSGVTHQGYDESEIPERGYFRNNLFIDCGFAAYECRGPGASGIHFEHNTCVNSGGGFSIQGEQLPRQSEIDPAPVGHHVFVWMIEKEFRDVYIRHNVFYEAPYGAAIYSIINPEDEKQLIIDHNCYWQPTEDLLFYMNRKSYGPEEFAMYQTECGQDQHSLVVDPLFTNAAGFDYRLRSDSPCAGYGAALKNKFDQRKLF